MYGFSLDLGAIVSSGGVPRPRLLGVGQASTFTGFCAAHDDSLFAEIEKNAIQASERHASLLAYRAICRELYAKEGGALLDPHRREIDRGMDPSSQTAIQEMNAMLMAGLSEGLDDIRERKGVYGRILTEYDYSDVRYCVIWFDAPPDIMCAACVTPDWDFDGKQLQDLEDLSIPAQSIVLSLVASEDQGCAYFAWLAHEERACASFLRSLLELGRDQIPHALVRFVLPSIENQFWRPDWWEALNEHEQESLIERFPSARNLLNPMPPDYHTDDGLRVVNWQIAGVESNDESLAPVARRLTAET